jgi:acetyl esterase/lipase
MVVSPAAIPVVNRLAGECIESVFDLIVRARTETPLEQNFLTVRDVTVIPPWKGLVALNTPGTLPTDVPVFIAQGTADAIVPPRITWDYARELCAAGSRVTLHVLRGGGHAFAAMHSARDAVGWIAARFAGLPAPSDCS